MHAGWDREEADEGRTSRWKQALIDSLDPNLREIITWVHNPELNRVQIRLVAKRLAATPVVVAQVEALWEELTWGATYTLPLLRGGL